MCIGAPLQVLRSEGDRAWCAEDGQGEWLDMRLVGMQAVGTWVLAFHGAARQVMDEQEAADARAARRALAAVMRGEGCVDDFFADLVARSPELPPHLRPSAPPKETP